MVLSLQSPLLLLDPMFLSSSSMVICILVLLNVLHKLELLLLILLFFQQSQSVYQPMSLPPTQVAHLIHLPPTLPLILHQIQPRIPPQIPPQIQHLSQPRELLVAAVPKITRPVSTTLVGVAPHKRTAILAASTGWPVVLLTLALLVGVSAPMLLTVAALQPYAKEEDGISNASKIFGLLTSTQCIKTLSVVAMGTTKC